MNLFRPAPIRAVIGAVAGASLVLGAGASVAGAHDGGALLDVNAAHEIGGGIHYIIEVLYEDDDHPAPDATVTATAVDPSGETQAPIELNVMDEDQGLYDGTVLMSEPGEWTVVFASLDPDGTVEHTQVVEASDGGPDEPLPPVVDDEAEPEVIQDNEDASLSVAAGDADDDSDDSPSVILLGLVAVVLAAVVALVFWLVMKRKEDGTASDEQAEAEDDSDTDGPAASASSEASETSETSED